LPFKNSDTSLLCQIETETGNAGEQPVRDKFDQTIKKSKKRSLSSGLFDFLAYCVCLQKPVNKPLAFSFAVSLWFLKLSFKAVKVPFGALFVFGIPLIFSKTNRDCKPFDTQTGTSQFFYV
jgi:hypothetical protein